MLRRQAAFGHIINQLVAYRTVQDRGAAGTLPPKYRVFFGRFSRVFATGASLLPVTVMVMVFARSRPGRCRSRREGHVSIFDPPRHRSRCLE
ncbi:hypothetical protein O9993_05545 [Vibrio lentus]|nr:hypothetical protein [Vibrio lentus]